MKRNPLAILFTCVVLVGGCSDDSHREPSIEAIPAAGIQTQPEVVEGYAETDDGVQLYYQLHGPADAPTILVGYPWTSGWSDIMEEMGAGRFGEQAGQEIIAQLTTRYRVLLVDYPRGTGASSGPLPDDLTPETVASDYVAVADAAGVDRFVAMGFSWSAGFGIHAASRTKRCAGLIVGGWPVLGAPHEEIVGMSSANTDALPPGKAKRVLGSNVNYYQSIIDSKWDAEAAVDFMSDRAGLLYLFVGSEDVGVPTLDITLPIAEPIMEHKARLEASGWKVDVIDGYDHMNLPVSAWLPKAMSYFEGKTW